MKNTVDSVIPQNIEFSSEDDDDFGSGDIWSTPTTFEPDNFGSGDLFAEDNSWGSSNIIVSQPNIFEVDEFDFSEFGNDLVRDEERYKQQEIMKQARPVVEEALLRQKDKMRVELQQALDDEVGHRLDKYEKRRKKREFKENIGTIFRVGIVLLILLLFFGNAQLRKRTIVVINDFGDLIHGLINGDEVHSNTLVNDLLHGIDDDINIQDLEEDLKKQNEQRKQENELEEQQSKEDINIL